MIERCRNPKCNGGRPVQIPDRLKFCNECTKRLSPGVRFKLLDPNLTAEQREQIARDAASNIQDGGVQHDSVPPAAKAFRRATERMGTARALKRAKALVAPILAKEKERS
jgi:hypothetical protein